jgi:Family of unknown function (DUF6445)
MTEVFGRSLYAYELRRVVVDGFYEDPEKVRQWALAADYHRPRDETIWRTRAKLFGENIEERLARCCGRSISRYQWRNDFNGTFFIACAQGHFKASPFIHFDTPTSFMTVIVFLTPVAFDDFGTTFYRHRRTGLLGVPDNQSLRRMNLTLAEFQEVISRDSRKKAAWEVVDQFAYRYNRALFFPAGLFHAASKNFGASKNNGRLWQSFHFGLKRGVSDAGSRQRRLVTQ